MTVPPVTAKNDTPIAWASREPKAATKAARLSVSFHPDVQIPHLQVKSKTASSEARNDHPGTGRRSALAISIANLRRVGVSPSAMRRIAGCGNSANLRPGRCETFNVSFRIIRIPFATRHLRPGDLSNAFCAVFGSGPRSGSSSVDAVGSIKTQPGSCRSGVELLALRYWHN